MSTAAPASTPSCSDPLLRAQGLGLLRAGQPLLSDLSFVLRPGLQLLRGGEGRGKTSLLGLIAGRLPPTSGSLERRADATVFFADLADPLLDPLPAEAWLAQQQAAQRERWQPALAEALIEAWGLAEHRAKPLYMLSTGSRRKLGLVGAAASGATLTLLDTPYAALDARSGRILSELLTEAAEARDRAWLLADYALPAALQGVALAGCIDLGD